MNLTQIIQNTLEGKRVEPKQRLVGGHFGWAIHRFPIKGGITLREVMAQSIMQNNTLLRRLCGRDKS